MAAGASGIDFGLLVVAADDGIMPQTLEHLAILSILGVAQGAVAVTKADRVDEARLHEVQSQVAQLSNGSFLQGAPVFFVNATITDDKGLKSLREYLHAAAQSVAARSPTGLFPLAAQRVFTLKRPCKVVPETVDYVSVSLR